LDELKPIGTLDGLVGRSRLGGWLWMPSSSERLTAEIMEGSRLVGRAVAELFRQDLLAAGIGDGRHGFEVDLPPSFFDGRFHTFWLRVSTAQGSDSVGDPHRVVLPRRVAKPGELPTANAIIKRIIRLDDEPDQALVSQQLVDAVSRLAQRYGDVVALNLLYQHCLGRGIDSGSLTHRLAHLAESGGDFRPVVEQVLASDEMANHYGTDPLASMPPTQSLTAWLDVGLS
jgi:hypothetical protein